MGVRFERSVRSQKLPGASVVFLSTRYASAEAFPGCTGRELLYIDGSCARDWSNAVRRQDRLEGSSDQVSCRQEQRYGPYTDGLA